MHKVMRHNANKGGIVQRGTSLIACSGLHRWSYHLGPGFSRYARAPTFPLQESIQVAAGIEGCLLNSGTAHDDRSISSSRCRPSDTGRST